MEARRCAQSVPHTDDFTANAAEVTRGGVWVGMVENGLDGFRRGGDSPRGGGDGSQFTVKSRVKPRAVKVWVGSRTHFFQFMMKPALVRASIRTSRMWMACTCMGEGGTEAIIDVDDHSPAGITAPVAQDGFQQSVEDVAAWSGRFPDRVRRTQSSV